MRAVCRYQLALTLRSGRWLPPTLLYAAVLAIGTGGGPPVLDGLEWAAATVLPVAAWLTRVVLTVEPARARACVAAATSPARAHLCALAVAVGLGLALAVAGMAESVLVARAVVGHGVGNRVPLGVALVGGGLAQLAAVLVGVAIGALCCRPVVRRPSYAIPLVTGGAIGMLVASGSPASAAVASIVAASERGVLRPPWFDALAALALFAVAAALTCRVAAHIDDD